MALIYIAVWVLGTLGLGLEVQGFPGQGLKA